MSNSADSLPLIEVYSRPGCHLCEQLIDELSPMVRDRFTVVVRNIDSNERWREQYGQRIPVVCVDNREICHYTLDKAAVLALCGTNQAF